MAAFWEYGYYAPTKPIEVKGGIKAKSKRGSFGDSWWAERWIEVLESFNIGERLTRGKRYARKGQVISIKIETGQVRAKVQGSSTRPYSVTIKMRTLTGSEWELLAEKLARKPIFAAKLLSGEMPESLEDIFEEAGLSLFPETIDDLETDCSCPDWSNPCKHIAAVYYLMAEEFDRDPFLLFRLRGVDREDFMSILGRESGMEATGLEAESMLSLLEGEDETFSFSPEPLPLDPEIFWGRSPGGPDIKNVSGIEAGIPSVPAALPKRLGKFPFWRGEADLLEVLEEICGKVSPLGMKVFLGEKVRVEEE